MHFFSSEFQTHLDRTSTKCWWVGFFGGEGGRVGGLIVMGLRGLGRGWRKSQDFRSLHIGSEASSIGK